MHAFSKTKKQTSHWNIVLQRCLYCIWLCVSNKLIARLTSTKIQLGSKTHFRFIQEVFRLFEVSNAMGTKDQSIFLNEEPKENFIYSYDRKIYLLCDKGMQCRISSTCDALSTRCILRLYEQTKGALKKFSIDRCTEGHVGQNSSTYVARSVAAIWTLLPFKWTQL